MNSTTQMMKIPSPKLSYLFRRAFGLFFIFVFSFHYGQMTLIGNVYVVEKNDSAVYVSPETSVCHSKNISKKKDSKSINVVIKSFRKRKKKDQKLSKSKIHSSKFVSQNQYLPLQTEETLKAETVLKTASLSSNDYHKKYIDLNINLFSDKSYKLETLHKISKTIEIHLIYFNRQFSIRPPPKLYSI